jgi:hypothetical protein
MDRIVWSKISLALWGDSEVAKVFIARLRQRYPGVRVFNRAEELRRQASATHILTHLEVADLDAVFSRAGTVEHAVIRCLERHQSFNYVAERLLQDRTSLNIMLRRMLDVIPGLLLPPPEPEAPQEIFDAEGEETNDQVAEQEAADP